MHAGKPVHFVNFLQAYVVFVYHATIFHSSTQGDMLGD